MKYNDLTSFIDVSSYTSLNNAYLVPSDGYIYVTMSSSVTNGENASINVYGSSKTRGIAITGGCINSIVIQNSMFVKRGMHLYADKHGANMLTRYYPLE